MDLHLTANEQTKLNRSHSWPTDIECIINTQNEKLDQKIIKLTENETRNLRYQIIKSTSKTNLKNNSPKINMKGCTNLTYIPSQITKNILLKIIFMKY